MQSETGGDVESESGETYKRNRGVVCGLCGVYVQKDTFV